MRKRTLEDIENIEGDFLTVTEVSEHLAVHPQYIRVAIRNGVPWGYVLGKCKFVIPKQAFVSFHKYGAVIKVD